MDLSVEVYSFGSFGSKDMSAFLGGAESLRPSASACKAEALSIFSLFIYKVYKKKSYPKNLCMWYIFCNFAAETYPNP